MVGGKEASILGHTRATSASAHCCMGPPAWLSSQLSAGPLRGPGLQPPEAHLWLSYSRHRQTPPGAEAAGGVQRQRCRGATSPAPGVQHTPAALAQTLRPQVLLT